MLTSMECFFGARPKINWDVTISSNNSPEAYPIQNILTR